MAFRESSKIVTTVSGESKNNVPHKGYPAVEKKYLVRENVKDQEGSLPAVQFEFQDS